MLIQKTNDSPSDDLYVNGHNPTVSPEITGTFVGGGPTNTIQVGFRDILNRTVFSDLTTLPSAFDLDDFDTAPMVFVGNLGPGSTFTGFYRIEGSITSVSASSIPEPSSLLLTAIGAAALLRRRSAKASA